MRSLIGFRRKTPGRPDPAPSRMAWRLERLLMTPGVRLALRAGIPFALALTAGLVWLSDETRRGRIESAVAEARLAISQRPEFMVRVMSVEGAGPEVAAEIREILPVALPLSSFDIDLEAIRHTISALDPVRDVTARIRPGGVLEIHVSERVPAVVWRSYQSLTLIDATGTKVAEVPTRMVRPDLPLVAGLGADRVVPEALALIQAAAPLGGRLRGLVRMGERRWDVVLDRGQRILLPEQGAVQALERVIALESAQDLLQRDLAQVDLRLARRTTLRMSKSATTEWWKIRGQVPIGAGDGTDDQD